MNSGSLFTGICGFDLALDRTGISCAWQCEIDPACRALEERHYPGIKRYEDVRAITRDNAEPVDLICGGFPCQDLSIAGKRAGLAGERSGLWFEFARVIDELEPSWVIIENVPGLLSSNGGRDFAVIIRWLAERGYGVAWRVLDAQYFGVPQRRRRVFIVGSFGNGRAAEVLFEREGSAGNTPPSRETGAGTPAATLRGFGHGWQGQHNDTNAVMVSHALSASKTATGRLDPNGQDFVVASSLRANGVGSARVGDSRGQDTIVFDWQSGGDVRLNISDKPMLQSNQTPAIAFSAGQSSKAYGIAADEEVTPPIRSGDSGTNRVPTIAFTSEQEPKFGEIAGTLGTYNGRRAGDASPTIGVRRLTPTECERLQGFPDGWTDGQSDSTRYRQLGNAVAVPVVEWIARRIAAL